MARSVLAAIVVVSLCACGGGGGGGPGTPGATLPAAFDSLAAGFTAETVHASLLSPARFIPVPDGRIFFNELSTGNTRILEADGTLVGPPALFHVDVLTGSHYGLLGIALDPSFDVNHYVYVAATVPPGGGDPARMQVIRFTESSGVATNVTVLVDDLPVAFENNSGDLVFDDSGNLFLSLGDNSNTTLPQDDASPAGKVHRFTALGGIPPTNPDPAKSEWCRGIRNTFALALHPSTGDLFGADNGSTSDDEVNYLEPAKNFGWPTLPGGATAGLRIHLWPSVVVPTGLAWHTGIGWGASFANNLFVTTYGQYTIRRLVCSGAAFTTVDSDTMFAQFKAGSNNPLCIRMEADGNLLVSTFNAIYRIKKL